MENKVILLITPAFAPRLSVTSLRITNYAKEFQRQGYKVFVVTCKYFDNNNMLDVPIAAEQVHYVDYFDVYSYIDRIRPAFFKKLLRKFMGLFIFPLNPFYPDLRYFFWRKNALKVASRLIQEHRISYVYSTYSPVSPHIIGHKLKTLHPHIKWIAEYRDLWSFNHSLKWRFKVFAPIQFIIEKRVVKNAHKLVTVSEGLASLFASKINRKVDVVYNGCDMSAHINISNYPFDKPILLYTGNVYADKYDYKVLVDGLSLFINRHPDKADFQILMLGTTIPLKWKLYMKEKNVLHYFKVMPKQNHDVVLSMQKSASALLFFSWNDPKIQGVLSGKIFEYLAAKNQILTIGTQEKEVIQLIETYGSGYFVEKSSDFCAAMLKILQNEHKEVLSHRLNEISKASQVNKILNLFEK